MKQQPIQPQPFFPPSFFPLPSSLWTEWNIPRTRRMKVSRAGCWSSFITKSFSILSKTRGPRARTHHTQDHATKPPVPLQRGSATRPSSSHCIRAIRACIPPLNTRELLLLWCRDKGRTASGHRPYQQRPWLPLTQLPPVLWSVQLHETHDGPQRLSCTLPRNRTQIPEF